MEQETKTSQGSQEPVLSNGVNKKLLQLTIARANGPLFDGEVARVTVPGASGEMTLLAGHEPLISPLKAGIILIARENGDEESFTIENGMLEVSNNRATVLI
ncbi:hypothetical protein KC722_02715 [Candidatus Kaiserbacteria bacterium]|nr:hypothetical protein [Candidatus Kaiserbacteria bacterium]